MPDAANAHRRPHPQAMAASYLEFDVATELEQLQREPGWHSGQNAKTLIKFDGLRVVLLALKAGSRIPEHRTEGQISIHAVTGHIGIHAQGRSFQLRSGGLLALDRGVSHDVEAIEDSALLLTIAWPVGPDGLPIDCILKRDAQSEPVAPPIASHRTGLKQPASDD